LTYVLPKEKTNKKENTLVAMAEKWATVSALPRVLGLKLGEKSGGSKNNNNNNSFVRTSFNLVSP
jgi:hypothetical protein